MSKATQKQEGGKIGNIIKYYRNGVQCERSMPASVFNPKTEKQQLVRSKFGLTSKLASNILHLLIHPYWNPIAKKNNRTGYNLFVGFNNPAFRNGILSAEILRLCLENGLNQEDYCVEKNENRIQIRWDSSISTHRRNDTDQLYFIVLKKDLKCKLIDTNIFRENDYCEYGFSNENEKSLFAFWRNEGKWSESKLVYSE